MVEKTHQHTFRLACAILTGLALILSTLGISAPATFAAPEDAHIEELAPNDENPTPSPAESAANPRDTATPQATQDVSSSQEVETPLAELQLALSTDEVATGESVSISGSGFSPRGPIQFSLDSNDLTATQADANGHFTLDIVTPETLTAGFNELTARDGQTGRMATATLTITETTETTETAETTKTTGTPEVIVDPTSAFAGDAINTSGTHFAEGEIDLTLEGGSLLETNADADGNFSAIVRLPQDLEPGDYTLVAHDENNAEAAAQLTILEDEADDSPATELELTTNTTEVHIGETIVLRLEGPEDFLAEHSTDDDPQDLILHSELTNTAGQRGVFTESGPTLADSGDGYRVFEYLVPEHQPTSNVFDDVGTISHGVYFTFFTRVDTSSSGGENGTSMTSNEVTVMVNGVKTEQATYEAGQEAATTLTIQPEQIDLDNFVGDPDEGAGVPHRVEGLTPGTEVPYTVNGPDNVEVLTQSATADDDGIVEFRIHGFESSATSVYLGDYTTAITFDERNGESGELTGNFTVTGQAPSTEAAEPGEIEPLGVNLATTGSSPTGLLVFAGLLLAVGGAIVIYTNRSRLFGRKEQV